MRTLLKALIVFSWLVATPSWGVAEECTGENCSAPATQSSPPASQGGHECEREKKEEVTS